MNLLCNFNFESSILKLYFKLYLNNYTNHSYFPKIAIYKKNIFIHIYK